MELTRKQVIDLLEKADSTVYKEPKTKLAQALEYAINSLKTDEAYQLMYEGGEIFTKADMVAMLTELDLTIDEIPIVTSHGVAGTVMTAQGMRKKIKENIQQRIDALK